MPRVDDPGAADCEPGPCHVVGVGCAAPAGYLFGDTVEEGTEAAEYYCDECWEPVCGPCSRVLADGRRVCEYCAEGERLAPDDLMPMPPEWAGGAKVMAKHCATCVFTARSPVGPERMRDLERQWRARDTHQTCHHAGVGTGYDDDEEDGPPTLDGEDIACYGFVREVFLRHGIGQYLRISANLGGFNYVDPADFGDLEEILESPAE